MSLRLVSLLGLFVLIGMAWAMSENRKAAPWRLVVWGVVLQFGIGILILHTSLHDAVFRGMKVVTTVLTECTTVGSRFVFGNLVEDTNINALMAFQVLPVIIFVSALAAILQHLKVIQVVVQAIAWLMKRTLKTSGAETFAAALLIFTGIESVTAVKAYLGKMTRSELCTVMTTFMATIAGSVLIIYATFGAEPGHLLTASLMSAPAAIVISKLMVPETGCPETSGNARVRIETSSRNVIDAAAQGTSQGLAMALQVAAMIIAFIALVHLLDLMLSVTGYTFVDVLAVVFRPFAYLLGVSSSDAATLAQLLGKKTVLNEFLAYLDLKTCIEQGTLSPRGVVIATYALCGFANPGSAGIMIAGLDVLVPERRGEVCELSVRAFIGGTLACFMTACVAGVLIRG
ncbi:MAG: NupC/NupG family nucleoside CNT transporter [Candidatus Hydrogenedentes bacterium]|nr:NupC/NupG family nucleoside CNT transporter [Candidatus Hydrogenedentota bacterium]